MVAAGRFLRTATQLPRITISMTKTTILAASILLCLHAGTASAQTAPDGSDDNDASTLDTISVVGTGQTRQVQSLGKDDLAREAAGASPLKAVAKLPGVNFQSADPWGNYEWSAKLSIRGFSQQQLGFTLDGIPLGDMSYGNHNGLHVSRAIISENVGRVDVAQGSGALGTASSSNLGRRSVVTVAVTATVRSS